MPDLTLARQRLCASTELVEGGVAMRFEVCDVRSGHERLPAFATRARQIAVAYLNRCAHMPTEMDWQPGQFWDQDKRHFICALHGALYDPLNGRCVSGPCRGASLQTIEVREEQGEVYWYPTERFQPIF